MSRKSMLPELQLQHRDTSPPASDEEQPQVQPLQSILKEPKYSKSVSFDESPTESTQEQTKDDSSAPNNKDTMKTPTDKAQQNLLKCHLQCGHMPVGILVQAAQQGILPKNIITKEYPKCPSCLYGKSTRRAWRTKTPHGTIAPLATKPGNVVSVDQMESSTPGFLGQNTGRLTRKHYKIATVFVDQASKLGYIYVQQSTDAAATIQAKQAFEAYARALGIEIKHYHAENSIFNSQEFLANIEQSQQTISFYGVGAHHQSGVAEHRVRELTEMACTQLLHVMHNNPKAINVYLWPYYALCHASYLFNHFPRCGRTESPLRRSPPVACIPTFNTCILLAVRFTSSQVSFKITRSYPTGTPALMSEFI